MANNNPNQDNLIQNKDQSPNEARKENEENGAKGGIASGKARRENKLYLEQLNKVIELGTDKALKEAREQGDKEAVEMIEEGGLIAFEHLNIVMNKKIKPETRLKALDMIIDRQEGKPLAKQEIKQERMFSDKIEYID